jgi:hypothetical protein
VDLVALVLAVGLSVMLVLITVGAIINVAQGSGSHPAPTLGENSTQVLTAAIGGVIGVLGTYVGYRVAEHNGHRSGRD